MKSYDERDITERDVTLEETDVRSIKIAQSIVAVVTTVGGVTIAVSGVILMILLGGIASIIGGIVMILFGAMISSLAWLVIKPFIGLLYDVKLLRYKLVDNTYRERLKRIEEKNINADLNKQLQTYKHGNTIIALIGDIYQISNFEKVLSKGRVEYLENNQVVVLYENNKKMTFIRVGDDLQGSNGTVYKKVASV